MKNTGNELTTNVKLLLSNRDKSMDSSKPKKGQWDSTCCLRNTGTGTRVDKRRETHMGVVIGPGRKRK